MLARLKLFNHASLIALEQLSVPVAMKFLDKHNARATIINPRHGRLFTDHELDA